MGSDIKTAACIDQRGIGMIEILVALIISAFALLGLAGLQIAALKSQKVSHFRALASQYGADMADRIRANAAAVTNKTAHYQTTDKYPALPTKPTCATSGTRCANAQEVADKDTYEWRSALNNALAGGWGSISAYDPINRKIIVTIYFREPGKKKGDVGEQCDPSAFPSGVDQDAIRCFQTLVTP